MVADLVFKNAKVITVDRDFSIQQAVAVKGDEIVAVGSDAEIGNWVGRKTLVLDLKGKPLLPGINDGHMHPTAWAASKPPYALNLRPPDVRSIRQIREMVRKMVRNQKGGEWIRGRGWNPEFLEECRAESRFPCRKDLDDITPDNPAVLMDWSGHNLWVNTQALALAGITKDTPDPPGGKIEKEAVSGDPTGVLNEIPAFASVMKHVPLFTREELKAFIVHAQRELNENGITSYSEPLGPGADRNESGLRGSHVIEAYGDLFKKERLTARVHIPLLFGQYGGVTYDDLKEGSRKYRPPRGLDPRWVRIPGIKIFADGVPPIKTAWMWEEYVTGGHGSLMVPGKTDEDKCRELKKMVSFAHRKGWQVAVHACGDRAISAFLDGVEAAVRTKPWIHPRHYIIHGDFIRSDDLRRAARYDVGVNMNPGIHMVVTESHVSLLGSERAAREFPYRTALSKGVQLAFSSDAGVTYPNWREGIQSAVLRKAPGAGKVIGPEERIKREEALRAYTAAAARQDHMECIKGSIEAGKLADFCIIGEDILTVDANRIQDIPVLMTIVGGRIVYDASGGTFA
jgi:predicted amidohydrolase YtcJ